MGLTQFGSFLSASAFLYIYTNNVGYFEYGVAYLAATVAVVVKALSKSRSLAAMRRRDAMTLSEIEVLSGAYEGVALSAMKDSRRWVRVRVLSIVRRLTAVLDLWSYEHILIHVKRTIIIILIFTAAAAVGNG